MSVDPFLAVLLAGMFGLLLIPGVALLAALSRRRDRWRAERSPLAYRAMVASVAAGAACLLLFPLALAGGVWSTVAALGQTPAPEGTTVGPRTIAALGEGAVLLLASGVGLVALAGVVAAVDALADRLAA